MVLLYVICVVVSYDVVWSGVVWCGVCDILKYFDGLVKLGPVLKWHFRLSRDIPIVAQCHSGNVGSVVGVMELSPIKTNPGKRLTLLYLLFLSGVGLIWLDLFSFPYEVI